MPLIPTWVSVARWMYFPWLSSSGSSVPVYTLGWRFEDHPDEWSRRFIGFKYGNNPDLRGCAKVLRVALPDLMTGLKLDVARTGLTVALSSGDKSINLASRCPK
jgi:hypothetical protein